MPALVASVMVTVCRSPRGPSAGLDSSAAVSQTTPIYTVNSAATASNWFLIMEQEGKRERAPVHALSISPLINSFLRVIRLRFLSALFVLNLSTGSRALERMRKVWLVRIAISTAEGTVVNPVGNWACLRCLKCFKICKFLISFSPLPFN